MGHHLGTISYFPISRQDDTLYNITDGLSINEPRVSNAYNCADEDINIRIADKYMETRSESASI